MKMEELIMKEIYKCRKCGKIYTPFKGRSYVDYLIEAGIYCLKCREKLEDAIDKVIQGWLE